MKYQFKTNINCGNCINSVTPFLNNELDIEHWEVDTDNQDKILTVETELKPQEVVEIVKSAGFTSEFISAD